MLSPDPFLVFTRKLNELGVRYMVSGGVAAIYYGEPRLATGVDIIVFLKRSDVPPVEKAFPLDEFYCPPPEIIHMEIAKEQRGHFNLIHHETGFKADIYTMGRDELHAWGLANARQITNGDDTVSLAPPEYVIVRKLQFYREGRSPKHLRDINRMLMGLGDAWNRETLLELIQAHGLRIEWQLALADEN